MCNYHIYICMNKIGDSFQFKLHYQGTIGRIISAGSVLLVNLLFVAVTFACAVVNTRHLLTTCTNTIKLVCDHSRHSLRLELGQIKYLH